MARLTNCIRIKIMNEEVAKKFNDKVNKAETELQRSATGIIEKSLPEFTEEQMEYVHRSSGFYIKDMKNGMKVCYTGRTFSNLPILRSNALYSSYHTVQLTKGLDTKIKKLKKLRSERTKYRSDLKECLYSFNTDTKLLEEVPEFKKYFVTHGTAMVVIHDFTDLRKKLRAK